MSAAGHVPVGLPIGLPAVVPSIATYPPELLSPHRFADTKDCLLRRLA